MNCVKAHNVSYNLAHPRLSAFITHCGLNSLNEAAASGVPLVTIPLFADQLYNSAIVKKRGIGTYLDIRYLTKEALVDALRAVLEDPRYRETQRLRFILEGHKLGLLEGMAPQICAGITIGALRK